MMDPDTGIVTDTEYGHRISTEQAETYKQLSAEKLKQAELREQARLDKPGFIDRIINGIARATKKKQTKIIQKIHAHKQSTK